MRRETRQYICAELLNYQRSKNEISRICRKIDDLSLWPAYNKDYTVEQKMYLQDRLYMLRKITEAIAAAEQDLSAEERAVLRLKFWAPKPRLTDMQIAAELNISVRTLYRHISSICKMVGRFLGTDL
nr:MAG TPA: ECF sigma factor [Caudoviricetes sp.]